MARILVFIPAYRCEKQISRVIAQFDDRVQRMIDTVMVVDNLSPDGTLRAAVTAAEETFTKCNFIAWKNSENYGLGGSHKAAFAYAIEHGFDYVVVLHGDDQANIQDLIPLLESEEYLKYTCLLGARFMPNSRLLGYSAFRTFGNKVYNWLFSIVAGHRIYDLGSGLNLYRVDALREAYYHRFPDDLTFNYVMLLASYSRRQNVRFFPISWREEDQVSNVRLFRQAAKVLGLLGGYMFGRSKFLNSELRSTAFARYSGTIQHAKSPER